MYCPSYILALKGGQILSWQGCRMNCPPLLPLCMGMVPHALGLNFWVFLLQELFIQIYAFLGPVSRKSPELFRPEKLVVKLQSACFEKLIFLHVFNIRKTKTIAKAEGLEPRRREDIKWIVAPEIGPKSFGTFEKQAPGLKNQHFQVKIWPRSPLLKPTLPKLHL